MHQTILALPAPVSVETFNLSRLSLEAKSGTAYRCSRQFGSCICRGHRRAGGRDSERAGTWRANHRRRQKGRVDRWHCLLIKVSLRPRGTSQARQSLSVPRCVRLCTVTERMRLDQVAPDPVGDAARPRHTSTYRGKNFVRIPLNKF